MNVYIKGLDRVVEADKVPAVYTRICIECGKQHFYFWKIRSGQGVEDDSSEYPNYATFPFCQGRVIK